MNFLTKTADRIASFTLALGLLMGCASQEGGSALLRFSADGAVFGVEGGRRTIEVAAYPKDEAWEVESRNSESWFSYTAEGNILTIDATPNASSRERCGELRIVSPKRHFAPYTLSVMQESMGELRFVTSANAEHNFDSEGGCYTFSVISSHEWTISTDAAWLRVEQDVEGCRASIIAEANTSEQALSGKVTIVAGGEQGETFVIDVTQGTRAENPYYQLCGKWEITADKWYYSPNGSLNSLDYAPSPSQYYLIFDIEAKEYGSSLVMRNFLYPGTELSVRYNPQNGGFTIPFGWTVYSYNVFFYVTMVSSTQFSYAALDVKVNPSANHTALTPQMPSVSGFNYVGFGLWTYNDSGAKVAVGSSSHPTMFPMGNIVFRKTQN